MANDPVSSPSLLARAQTFFGSRRGKATLLVGLFILVFGAAGVAAYNRYVASEETSGVGSFLPDLTLNSGPAKHPAVLTGEAVEEERAKRRPLAVMVENHPEARPQAGLVHADVVWEAIVEGGITRFMAIFSSEDAGKIGPVRSARPYYVHWAAGFNALYAHAGGSQAALALIPNTSQIVDLPHTAAYFHREPKPGIASEHTLFTSTEKLYEFAKEKEVSLDASITSYKFEDDAKAEDRPASAKVGVEFSTANYNVEWNYERDPNYYTRTMAGEKHVDRESGDQITAKNIVVIEVDRRYDGNTNQGKGEWFMTTEGSGKATIFQNGTVIEGQWKKTGIGDMLKIYDGTNGMELPLVRGTTWFEVVPPGTTVTHEETAAAPTTTPQS